MDKVVMIICIAVILIISGFILAYFTLMQWNNVQAEFVDIEFYALQPTEGYYTIGSDGYVHYNDEGENYKISYIYDEENNTVTYNSDGFEYQLNILYVDPDKEYMLVERKVKGDPSIAIYHIPSTQIDDFFETRDGSLEKDIKIGGTVYTFSKDNTYVSEYSPTTFSYRYACLKGTEYCDFLLMYNHPNYISMIAMNYNGEWMRVLS
ncbi:MAG: hypothetical protein J6X28_05915 [Bacilli bacterium]|nr:hypothetical protein [Bacilli bacterium]